MSKNLRHPELSEKNPYWIERHRYYELKHFCLQYPLWKKEYDMIDGASKRGDDLGTVIQVSGYGDPTAKAAEAMIYLSTRMDMVMKGGDILWLTKEPAFVKLCDRVLSTRLRNCVGKVRLTKKSRWI